MCVRESIQARQDQTRPPRQFPCLRHPNALPSILGTTLRLHSCSTDDGFGSIQTISKLHPPTYTKDHYERPMLDAHIIPVPVSYFVFFGKGQESVALAACTRLPKCTVNARNQNIVKSRLHILKTTQEGFVECHIGAQAIMWTGVSQQRSLSPTLYIHTYRMRLPAPGELRKRSHVEKNTSMPPGTMRHRFASVAPSSSLYRSLSRLAYELLRGTLVTPRPRVPIHACPRETQNIAQQAMYHMQRAVNSYRYVAKAPRQPRRRKKTCTRETQDTKDARMDTMNTHTHRTITQGNSTPLKHRCSSTHVTNMYRMVTYTYLAHGLSANVSVSVSASVSVSVSASASVSVSASASVSVSVSANVSVTISSSASVSASESVNATLARGRRCTAHARPTLFSYCCVVVLELSLPH